jgi:pimeloyl-ACP methyl ester carboxylesterase
VVKAVGQEYQERLNGPIAITLSPAGRVGPPANGPATNISHRGDGMGKYLGPLSRRQLLTAAGGTALCKGALFGGLSTARAQALGALRTAGISATVPHMPREMTFGAKSARLNYLDYGSSSNQPLVMLHGGAWRWQEYLSLIPSLGRRWHVYAVDLRGNGRSGWVPDTYRLRDFAQDNAEFVSRLNAPAVLVGHSIGGVIALMVAARYPDRVKAVIIEDIPLSLDNYRKFVDSSRDLFGLWLSLKKSAQSEQGLALALADAYKDYPGVTSASILFFAGCLWQLDPTYFNALLRDFDGFAEGYDYQSILAKINCPLLFLRGETRLGAVMTDDEISWLQTNFGNVQCARIGGVGHLLHLQDEGQTPVLNAMRAFLEGV